jgi:Na+/H+ antiporter NhaC
MHALGISGLAVIFVIGTLRPINLGALALVMTFLVGTFVVGEGPREMYSGFPVDLLVLLAGVTYLFGVAVKNGTVDRIVDASVRAAQGRRALIPWVVFALAAAPAMAGALGSTGVALLAPLAMRVAERCEIDRRLMGLMVVHGAAAGNFSPLNVLGAIVRQAVVSRGLHLSVWTLFAGNLAANLILAAVLVMVFSGRRQFAAAASSPSQPVVSAGTPRLTAIQSRPSGGRHDRDVGRTRAFGLSGRSRPLAAARPRQVRPRVHDDGACARRGAIHGALNFCPVPQRPAQSSQPQLTYRRT